VHLFEGRAAFTRRHVASVLFGNVGQNTVPVPNEK
jgi:hypothetical protein